MLLKIISDLNKIKSIFFKYFHLMRETAWIAIGQIAALFGSFFLIRFLTDNLTVVEYGELALALTLAMMVNQVISGGICGGILRFYSIAIEKGERELYLAGCLQLLTISSMVCVGVSIALIAVLVTLNLYEWLWISVFMMCFAIISGINSAIQSIQNAARNRVLVAMHQALEVALRILFAFLLFQIYYASSLMTVVAYVLSGFFVLISQVYFLNRLLPLLSLKVPNFKSNDYSPKIWSQAWPISAWGVFTGAQISSDRWALGYFGGIEDIGAYAVIYQLGFAPVVLVAGVAVSLLAPILFQKAGDASTQHRVEEVYRVTKIITVIALPCSFIVAFFGHLYKDWIFSIAVNENFHEYSYLFPLMILAAGFHGCHQIIGMRFSASLNVKKLLLPQILSALLFVIFNFLGAYIAGVNGLVYAFLGASLIYFLWILVFSEIIRYQNVKDGL